MVRIATRRSPRPRGGRLFSVLLLPLLLMALEGRPAASPPAARPAVPPVEKATPVSPDRPVEALPSARLDGRVVDEVTGDGISGAVVEIPELRMGCRCDPGGRFRVADIPPRPEAYEVLVRAKGHRSRTVEITFEGPAVLVETFSLRPLGY